MSSLYIVSEQHVLVTTRSSSTHCCIVCSCSFGICRKRNNVNSRSSLSIKLAEADIYVAHVDDKLVVKLGPKHDMPEELVPREDQGWKVAACGLNYCIWEKAQ